MRRGLVGLFCTFVAVAQPQRDPIQATYSAYHQARQAGRFDEAIAKREELRRLVAAAPVESPQFGTWVQMTAGIYDGAGMNVQSRAITEQALDRVAVLGESSPVRIQLLTALGAWWQQDRNLLKAIAYMEKAAAAAEKAPAAPKPPPSGPGVIMRVSKSGGGFGGSFYITGLASIYMQLARVYRQLGRPESVNQVLAKMRALGPDNESALASIYQSEGRPDDAAAIYKSRAERTAADPTQSEYALQSLANLYQQQERYGDAASAMQQAISAAAGAGLQDQVPTMRRQLAGFLSQAGQTEAADQAYQQLLANPSSRDWRGALLGYANHLADTGRASQALALLKDYLDSHSDLEPYEQSTILFAMSSASQKAGNAAQSDEYTKLAIAKQSAAQQRVSPPDENTVQRYLNQAQGAINEDADAAFGFGLQALDAASAGGPNREQVMWSIPNLASGLVAHDQPEKAEQLYQRLSALVASWTRDTMQPALQVSHSYAEFLLSRKNQRDEAADAIERYRSLLTASRGEETGWQEDVLRMTINLERARGATARAVIVGQDLLALEESLNGPTSDGYLRAIETLAGIYEWAGDKEHELNLRQQAVGIVDLVSIGNDPRRVQARRDAARVLEQMQRFDEAKKLTADVAAIGKTLHPQR